ncbi:MAG: exopolysaccharide biosynthesis polyprenyl glycosylphosphotransferase [Alistipes sp.]|nr:exopolysaccharide biosynthesis polyprenyl glycosylphosphotransferase [Alistipes sp.]
MNLGYNIQKCIKRIFDIFVSLTIIIVLSPLWLVLALWICLSSPGGVFFAQTRTGYHGKDFKCLKFRSMYVNGEADSRQAVDNDPRITPIGRFMRRSSIDEFPQLINVLRGDMSLVGPRPHMLKHTEIYSALIPHYMERHNMRPGLTGYAQIKGFRGETPHLSQMRDRVKADLVYIHNFSLWLDIKILAVTAWKVVKLKL